MGQNSSSPIQDFITNSLGKILMEDSRETSVVFDNIQSMSYEDFVERLQELNKLCQKCLDPSGAKLVFAVKKGTDGTLFWKATVQIACVKLDATSNKIATFRLLNLREFVQVFDTLKCQYSAVLQSKSDKEDAAKITASAILGEVDVASKANCLDSSPSECVICFERKPNVLLPCAHSYCLQCIEEWNEDHDTCPICREKLESPDDTWVLSDVPKAEEISQEIRTTLMDLAEDKSPPCSPS